MPRGTPMFAVVLRKAYGLGRPGHRHRLDPGTGLLRRLAHRRVRRHGPGGLDTPALSPGLENETDPAARQALSDKLLSSLYARGEAINVAATLEIDAVIDPANTQRWIVQDLKICRKRHAPRRQFVEAWHGVAR